MTLVLGAFALSTCLNGYSWSPTAAAEPVCLHLRNPFQLRDICNGKLNRTYHSQVCCNAYHEQSERDTLRPICQACTVAGPETLFV